MLIAPVVILVAWIIIFRFPWPAYREPAKNTLFGLRAIMMMVVTVSVLASALYVILSAKFDADAQKWAFGVVGVLVGFWLNQERDNQRPVK